MTDEQMKGLAHQALNMIRTQRAKRERPFVYFLGVAHSGVLTRMERVEDLIVATEGPHWPGNDDAKERVFSTFRRATQTPGELEPPQAYVLGSGMRMGDSNEDRSLWKDGLLVSVETRERFCYLIEPIGEPPRTEFYPSAHVSGRMKMFQAEAPK